jgi:hypothetical protein
MTKTLVLPLGWINLYVTVDVSDDGIEQVMKVQAEGSKEPLKCDLVEFLNCFEGELGELLEEAKMDDYVAACEMRMDAEREEGRI